MSHFQLWLKHRVATSALAGPVSRLRRLRARLALVRRPEAAFLFIEGAYLRAALDRLIRPGDNCLDIGAHIGSVAYDLRRRAPEGRLDLIEALDFKARWLARRFPDCEVHRVAVSDRDGEATFYENRAASGFSSLTRSEGAVEHKVRVARLDDLIGHDVDFIKIDVEGHELEALRGGREMLRRSRPAILFEAGAITEETRARSDALYGFLREEGYEILAPVDIYHRRPPLGLEEFNRCRRYPFVSFNFFALPPERMTDIS